jgi:hypothetical protein
VDLVARHIMRAGGSRARIMGSFFTHPSSADSLRLIYPYSHFLLCARLVGVFQYGLEQEVYLAVGYKLSIKLSIVNLELIYNYV